MEVWIDWKTQFKQHFYDVWSCCLPFVRNSWLFWSHMYLEKFKKHLIIPLYENARVQSKLESEWIKIAGIPNEVLTVPRPMAKLWQFPLSHSSRFETRQTHPAYSGLVVQVQAWLACCPRSRTWEDRTTILWVPNRCLVRDWSFGLSSLAPQLLWPCPWPPPRTATWVARVHAADELPSHSCRPHCSCQQHKPHPRGDHWRLWARPWLSPSTTNLWWNLKTNKPAQYQMGIWKWWRWPYCRKGPSLQPSPARLAPENGRARLVDQNRGQELPQQAPRETRVATWGGETKGRSLELARKKSSVAGPKSAMKSWSIQQSDDLSFELVELLNVQIRKLGCEMPTSDPTPPWKKQSNSMCRQFLRSNHPKSSTIRNSPKTSKSSKPLEQQGPWCSCLCSCWDLARSSARFLAIAACISRQTFSNLGHQVADSFMRIQKTW